MLLDRGRATLHGGREKLVGQGQAAALHAAAAEDALRELVPREAQQAEHVMLGERASRDRPARAG